MTMSINSAALRSRSGGMGHKNQPPTPSTTPPTKAASSRRQLIGTTPGLSCAKGQAGAGRWLYELVWHRFANGADEVVAAAMHRDDDIGIEGLDLADHLLDVIVGRCPEMETADQSVHLLHARHFLRLLRRIDDAYVANGAQHHEAAILRKHVACSW